MTFHDETTVAARPNRSATRQHSSTQSAPGHPPLKQSISNISRRQELTQTRSYVDSHGSYYSRNKEANPRDVNENGQDEKTEEVTWDGDDDPTNPKNWKTWRKWLIVFTLAAGSMCVTMTSSIYTLTYDQMGQEFGTSRIVNTLGLTLFVFGLGSSPLILGPLSEFFGRRIIYIAAYILFTIWLIPSAVAPNIQTMLIARFLDGFSGSAFLSVAGGTVGDMFTKEHLAAPMMIYSAAPFLGPG